MCGIFTLFGNPYDYDEKEYEKILENLTHRGPDHQGIQEMGSCLSVHTRLSIVGVNNGCQPIINDDCMLCVNGEIYNYQELKTKYFPNYQFITESDCEIIIPMYKKFGYEFINQLDGVFAFTLFDWQKNIGYVGRDPIGVNSLYIGNDKNGNVLVSSEAKTMIGKCVSIDMFKNGTYQVFGFDDVYRPHLSIIGQYFRVNEYYFKPLLETSTENAALMVKKLLENSVKKRLMAEVPFGVLLSGGLDSSLVAAITSKLSNKPINTFSIGLKGAPDLKYAKIVADHIGSIHHEFNFTVEEGIECLRKIIWHLETFDVTTIRASIPMFLLSKKIKELGFKMVLSGEGADEILGGYLYFHQAPDVKEFHKECVSRVENLSYFDCLRANKSTMAHGLEARVPFLDKEFLDKVLPISKELKLNNNIEKYILRKAFDENASYLPDEILWRQKEQFSDGVGYHWIDSLKEFCEKEVDTPIEGLTKEATYYYNLYKDIFGNQHEFVRRWIPNTKWADVCSDPSGRAQKIHVKAIN